MRREIIDSAVKFLQDPKVQQAPLDKRLAFLQSKGLTQEEIDQAVKESNTNSANSSAVSGTGNTVANTSAAQPAYAPAIPPMVPAKVSTPTTWKDVSLALVGMAGVGYALKYAWVKLVMPYLDFPDAKTVRNDTNLIQSSLENNSSTISLVKNQTTDLMAAMESHANGVSNTLDEINTLLSSLKASDAKKNDDIVSIQAELDELKSTFPKVIFKFYVLTFTSCWNKAKPISPRCWLKFKRKLNL
ncbi:peroxisomal membrane anchor protein conserved region-domain-containing protein [Globomyces pollinis-pini]|nr:peroxisomal membrane anchor protein conserved region-domain-containing protein [Globomyces pollinis-pini]